MTVRPPAFAARRGRIAALLLLALLGCSHPGPRPDGDGRGADPVAQAAPAQRATDADPFEGWSQRTFPGKRATRYRVIESFDHPQARWTLRADADRSASMLFTTLPPGARDPATIRFSWRIERPISTASLRDREAEDAPVRVVLAFDGPVASLPLRERMFFDLAQAITGEAPPYATLMYVWDRTADVGDVIPSNSTTRIRKIVVDGRDSPLGAWRVHQRSIEADFRAAFGEAPGRLTAIGVMTDTDNTGYRLRAWYGPVEWSDAAGHSGLPSR